MCHKKTFSQRQAETAIERAKKSKNPDRKECRMYYCDHHKGYHLTSQEYDRPQQRVKLIFISKWKQLLKTG